MNSGPKMKFAILALAASFLTACSTGHIDPADRDTTGAYDGFWIGKVDKPRSSKVILPGNWEMSCSWEPFEIFLAVADGRAQLGRLENKSPVSKAGDFRIDIVSEDAGMVGGIMSGNGNFVQVFSGNLSGEDPRGVYKQYSESLGKNGCSAKIRFAPYGS